MLLQEGFCHSSIKLPQVDGDTVKSTALEAEGRHAGGHYFQEKIVLKRKVI